VRNPKEKKSAEGLGRLIPILDFCLLMVVATFGLAGFQRLATKTESPPSFESPKDDALIAARQRELAQMEREAAGLSQRLDGLRRQSDQLAQSDEEIEKAKDAIKKLGEAIKAGQEKYQGFVETAADVSENGGSPEDIGLEIKELEERLQKARSEIAVLTKKLAEIPAGPGGLSEGTPCLVSSKNLEPVFIMITEGRVLPVRDPHFTFEKKYYKKDDQIVPVIQVTKAGQGEVFSQACKENSVFCKVLDEMNKEKQFVSLLVDSTSFEAYRTVRQFIKKRGLLIGWEPIQSTTLFFGQGGIKPDPQDTDRGGRK